MLDKIEQEQIVEYEEHISKLVELRSTDNWGQIRKQEGNFKLVKKIYSFGERYVYEPIKEENNLNLQSSRGININTDSTTNDIALSVNKDMQLKESDYIRINELEALQKSLNILNGGFCEIGFRIPKLMRYYHDNYGMSSFGYDYNPLSVGVTSKMGYEVYCMNLMTPTKKIQKLKNANLVVCYHVIEHLSSPLKSLSVINKNMKKGAYLHIEIPIEPGIPRLRFAHLFAFENGDLAEMGRQAGFEVLNTSLKTHAGGGPIERCLMVKL
tara:strand:- start:1561 stop:2367 length:807 start_codon:yes stop_codon:yes gene_type:complete